MPNLIGTIPAGNRTLTGIESPKVNVGVAGGPLDVSNFFRASALQLQQRGLDLERERLDFLKEREMLNFTRELFNGVYSQVRDKDGTMYGLDPLNPAHNATITRINSTLAEAQNQAFSLASASRGQNPAETARQINNIVSKAKLQVFNDPEYKQQAINQKMFEQTVLNVGQEARTGKEIDPKFYDFINKYRQSVSGIQDSPLMGPDDFDPRKYVFSDKSEAVDQIVTGAIGNTKLAEVIRASGLNTGLPGDISVEVTMEVQREFEDALAKAYTSVLSDPEIMRYFEATGKDPVEYLVNQIKLKSRDESLKKVVTGVQGLEAANRAVIEGTKQGGKQKIFEDADVNELYEQLNKFGYGVNGIEDYEKLNAIVNARKKNGVIIDERGDKVIYKAKISPADDQGELIAEFTKSPIPITGTPLTKEITPEGVLFRQPETGGSMLVPQAPATTPLTATTETPASVPGRAAPAQAPVANTDDPAFENLSRRESAGGTKPIKRDDAGQATVGDFHFGGELGNKFLQELGIEGFDMTKPLTEQQENELNAKLPEKSVLSQKSREFFTKEILPGLKGRVKEAIPQIDTVNMSAALRLPLYSMGVNHSPVGQKKILEAAARDIPTVDPTDEQIIDAIVDARIDYVLRTGLNPSGWKNDFKKTNEWKEIEKGLINRGATREEIDKRLNEFTIERLKRSLTNRYEEEREEALELLKNPPKIQTPVTSPTTPTLENPLDRIFK